MEMSKFALVASVLLAPALAFASPDGGPHRGPPQQAVAACTSKSAGDACTMTFHDQPVNGVCRPAREGEVLACHPPPPKAAVDACAGRAANDSCQMTFPDGTAVLGTCAARPDGNDPLACRPPHHGRHPGGPAGEQPAQ